MFSSLLICASAFADFEGPIPNQQETPPTIKIGKRAFQSLNDAIHAIGAQGGTITLGPGTLRENVVIDRKVTITGASAPGKVTRIISPDRAKPAIDLIYPAAATLKHLTLSGGSSGIHGEIAQVPGGIYLPKLSASGVRVFDSQRGIYGSFKSLSLNGVEASRNELHGISLLRVDALKLINVKAKDNRKVGILIQNKTKPPKDIAWVVAGTDKTACEISGNAEGGIEVVGGAAGVLIRRCHIHHNGEAGITFYGAKNALVRENQIDSSFPSSAGVFGDGVRVFYSDVNVSFNDISYNARAGLSSFVCPENGQPGTVSVSTNDFAFNAFDLENGKTSGCPSFTASLEDGKGNECRPGFNGSLSCRAESASIEPIAGPKAP